MIKPIGREWAKWIEANQPYPEAMCEDAATFERLLKSGHCLGYFERGTGHGGNAELQSNFEPENELLGWILLEEDPDEQKSLWFTRGRPELCRQVYCYDLAVLPEHQRKGIGRQLWCAAARELRWLGYRVRVHCRRTSYEIFANYGAGYEIAADRFIPDHYAKEYEDNSLLGEHAHELWLKPIGQ